MLHSSFASGWLISRNLLPSRSPPIERASLGV
jgi:hypothetical protein